METENESVFIHTGLSMDLLFQTDRIWRGWGGLGAAPQASHKAPSPFAAQAAFLSPQGHRGSCLVFEVTEICAPVVLSTHQRIWDSQARSSPSVY